MDNIITIGTDIPAHLVTYFTGILAGMGVSYTINPESPLYKIAKEYRREKYLRAVANGEIGDTLPPSIGYYLSLKGGDAESIKVTMTPVCSEEELYG